MHPFDNCSTWPLVVTSPAVYGISLGRYWSNGLSANRGKPELHKMNGLFRFLFIKKKVRSDMDVSKNSGTPKSSILIGFSHYKPSILGYPYFWKHLYGGMMWDDVGWRIHKFLSSLDGPGPSSRSLPACWELHRDSRMTNPGEANSEMAIMTLRFTNSYWGDTWYIDPKESYIGSIHSK